MMYLCTYQRGSHYKWNGGEELVTERHLRFVVTICEYQCQDPVRLQRAHQAHRLWRRLTIGNTCLRRRRWHPTPVLLPGKPHGWRSLVGCSPWGCKELDTTEQLHFHFSLSQWWCQGTGLEGWLGLFFLPFFDMTNRSLSKLCKAALKQVPHPFPLI